MNRNGTGTIHPHQQSQRQVNGVSTASTGISPSTSATATSTSTPAAASSNEPPVVHRKIAVLGFRAVGKSSLTYAFVSGTFSENYDPTIENTHHKTIRFRSVHFETDIVDTAGMDEYSRLSRNASVGVNGYMLVFAITSRQSFEGLKHIHESLLNTLGDATDVPRVIVGSMRDLSDHREVTHQEGQALADSWGVPYLECSSKTGLNVNEVFHSLLKEVEKDEGLFQENQKREFCTIL